MKGQCQPVILMNTFSTSCQSDSWYKIPQSEEDNNDQQIRFSIFSWPRVIILLLQCNKTWKWKNYITVQLSLSFYPYLKLCSHFQLQHIKPQIKIVPPHHTPSHHKTPMHDTYKGKSWSKTSILKQLFRNRKNSF